MVYQAVVIFVFLVFSTTANAFDHNYRKYSGVLSKYVHDGRVDYAALQKDRAGIDEFVSEVESVTGAEYAAWSRAEQFAFWINTYNGWFLQIVINHYPIRGGKLFGFSYPKNSVQRIPGIWDGIKLKTAGREVSLNDIEHRVARPLFQEPRIHFSIVCASKGCPPLRSEPFLSDSLETQLEAATRNFINNPDKVKWDEAGRRLEISKIFDWFSDDFASSADEIWKQKYPKKQAGPVAFISKYLPEPVRRSLKESPAKILFLEYDWTLNE